MLRRARRKFNRPDTVFRARTSGTLYACVGLKAIRMLSKERYGTPVQIDTMKLDGRSSQDCQVDELAKQVAEAAIRLAALPADGSRHEPQTLDAIELLAKRILNEVAAVRRLRCRDVGESSGVWRAMQPMHRQ
jgi:hypothetical protein